MTRLFGLPEERWLLLDDTRLSYSGSWDNVTNIKPWQTTFGIWGDPYENTLQEPKANGASVSFSFRGTRVALFGGFNATDTTNKASVSCIINGNKVDTEDLQQQANNQVICKSGELVDPPPDGQQEHHFSMTVDTLGDPSSFTVDSIQYIPSSSESVDNAVLLLPTNDTSVQRSADWPTSVDDPSEVVYEGDAGIALTVVFQGVSASMYGFAKNGTLANSTHSYSINGTNATNFIQLGSKDSSFFSNNLLLFNTGELAQGRHTLTVTAGPKNDTTMPLSFAYFLVGNGSLPVTPTTGNVTLPTGGSSQTSASSKPISPGAIAGGVVGSVVAIGACVFFALFLMRRNRKRQDAKKEVDLTGGIGYNPSALAAAPFVRESMPPRASMMTSGPMSIYYAAPSSPDLERAQSQGRASIANFSESGSSSGSSSSSSGRASMKPKGKTAGSQPSLEQIVEHQDSGMRLAEPPIETKTVDLPPRYTAE